MNAHGIDLLRRAARPSFSDSNGRRADSPSALLSAAARRSKFRLTRVQGNHYVVSGGRRVIGGFAIHLTSLPSSEALRASDSLPLVKQYLQLDDLPVPAGAVFAPEQAEAAAAHFSAMTSPAVVKPARATQGAGVTVDIRTAEQFRSAWAEAVAARPGESHHDQRLVIEEHVPGLDVRAYVVGENVVAAVARVPLFCVGDGARTVAEQLTEVSALRDAHPLLGKFPYDAAAYAEAAGMALDETTTRGEVYFFSDGINMRSGGVTIDVTTELAEEVQDLAVEATWAVPGCKAGGVDLVLASLDSTAGAKILDVDVQAEFTTHHYPWIGERRQVAAALISKMDETARG